MAVSLSEAWNDPEPALVAAPMVAPPSTSAASHVSDDSHTVLRSSSSQPKVSAKYGSMTLPDVDDGATTINPVASTDVVGSREYMLLTELRMLRMEQSRRCTVYLAIGVILFAVLFVYIDRLQSQIRVLNLHLRHSMVPRVANNPLLVAHPEVAALHTPIR